MSLNSHEGTLVKDLLLSKVIGNIKGKEGKCASDGDLALSDFDSLDGGRYFYQGLRENIILIADIQKGEYSRSENVARALLHAKVTLDQ
ncbi:MAG: hypothetical protein Crog4KO_36300 [Crocinitomicaceae bacterium]